MSIPASLLIDASSADLLAELCRRLPSSAAAEVVRAALAGLEPSDRATRRRQQTAARTRAYRDRLASHGDGPVAPNVTLSVTHPVTQCDAHQEGSGVTGDAPVTLSASPRPQVSPVPPSSPASSPTATPTHARPTVEEVIAALLENANCRVPKEDQAEVAQAYLDNRNRSDPPWTLPATHDRLARPIGADWQADCRQFSRHWQDVSDRQLARELASNGAYANSVFKGRGNGFPKTDGNSKGPHGTPMEERCYAKTEL